MHDDMMSEHAIEFQRLVQSPEKQFPLGCVTRQWAQGRVMQPRKTFFSRTLYKPLEFDCVLAHHVIMHNLCQRETPLTAITWARFTSFQGFLKGGPSDRVTLFVGI